MKVMVIEDYVKSVWRNGRAGNTPIVAEKLNKIESGIGKNREFIKELEIGLQECFTSVSDGKALVASAITGKGVRTEATASFAVMAANVKKIAGGGKGKDTVQYLTMGKSFEPIPVESDGGGGYVPIRL